MDASLSSRFVKALANKLKKRSYLPFLEKYGQGYLIVPVHHLWFDARTIQGMKDCWQMKQPVDDLGCFKEVYIAYWSGGRRAFRRWPV